MITDSILSLYYPQSDNQTKWQVIACVESQIHYRRHKGLDIRQYILLNSNRIHISSFDKHNNSWYSACEKSDKLKVCIVWKLRFNLQMLMPSEKQFTASFRTAEFVGEEIKMEHVSWLRQYHSYLTLRTRRPGCNRHSWKNCHLNTSSCVRVQQWDWAQFERAHWRYLITSRGETIYRLSFMSDRVVTQPVFPLLDSRSYFWMYACVH